MISVISVELFKIFKKWRTYIGFIAVAVLVPLIQIAMLIEGENSINYMTRNLQQSFVFVGNILNGYLISYIVLNSLHIHIPFLIALVTGDILAGEATAGTYRLILTRPVSRFNMLTSKFIAGMIYSNLLVLWLAAISLILGYILFGVGELLVVQPDNIIVFAREDVLWRFLLSYCFAGLSMMVVASLAFLFSSLVENAIGPIASTMAIIIVLLIISALQIDFFQALQPYLFTSYMPAWRLFFDDPIDMSEVLTSGAVLLGHVVLFYGLALFIFKRKDVLS